MWSWPHHWVRSRWLNRMSKSIAKSVRSKDLRVMSPACHCATSRFRYLLSHPATFKTSWTTLRNAASSAPSKRKITKWKLLIKQCFARCVVLLRQAYERPCALRCLSVSSRRVPDKRGTTSKLLRVSSCCTPVPRQRGFDFGGCCLWTRFFYDRRKGCF